ncbi:hypothetical protein EWB00_000772, partial [Schistosoma japonicum]
MTDSRVQGMWDRDECVQVLSWAAESKAAVCCPKDAPQSKTEIDDGAEDRQCAD